MVSVCQIRQQIGHKGINIDINQKKGSKDVASCEKIRTFAVVEQNKLSTIK